MNLLAHRNLKRALILTFALVIFAFNSNGDNVSAETTILEGIALKDRTHVYESTNRNSKSLKSYREGSILLYQPHSTNWYKATVFVNGNRQTGYIHASDVETATTGGATLQGIALKNSTKVYSRGSKNASSPRSYSQGRLLYYEAYTSEWYKGFIISNGSRQNVYIHVDDVETKVDQQESLRGVASKDRTNIYSRASKNSSTLKSYAQGSVLLYKTFTSEWYEAIVFVNGKRTTGYIHKDDVENIINEQVQLNGVAKETVNVYSSASRNSSTLKSYRTGSSLIYKTYSTNWYEAIVFVNGKRTTGYIHRDDVENKQYDPRHLNGIATKNRTNVYQGPSSNSSVLRSYPEGRVLMYRTFSDNWYEATVIINGKSQTGYIHQNDVENIFESQESLEGRAKASPTNVYSSASKNSSVLRSYSKGSALLYKTYSDNWYEAIVFINGEPTTGYIHKNDVGNIEETHYDRVFDELVDIWMSKSPQFWTPNGWRDATRVEVEFFANPDNFRNEDASEFFQFLVLSEPAGLDVREINEKVLSNKGTLTGTGEAFVQAGRIHNINEVYLLAHAIHETGNGSSELAQGVEYNGRIVYNMYGIGAYDRCAVECGAEYAYNQGWFTPEDAIIGGAEFISSGYIQRGQDTLYKMRWNPANPGEHQYATDVRWATAQTGRIASLYEQIDNYQLFFDIPVYNEMPSSDNMLEIINVSTTLNIRPTPSTSGSPIGSLRNGQYVRAVTDSNGNFVRNGNWYQIYIPGSNNTGWVSGDYATEL